VVLRGKDHIAHAGVLEHPHPFIRVEFVRVKCRSQFGGDAEMDEGTKLGVPEPLVQTRFGIYRLYQTVGKAVFK